MKTAQIEVANSHFFGFPTIATVVREDEITPIVAELIIGHHWFEAARFEPDRWSIRVKAEVHPLVNLMREQLS